MIRLGLTGWPVSHSLSPKLHNAALKAFNLEGEYSLYPINPSDPRKLEDLVALVRSGYLTGLNITVPYKQSIIHFLDELTSNAKMIGAVNTIYLDGKFVIGDNTDAAGFLVDLQKSMKSNIDSHLEAIVLGAGGSARAVVFSLIGISKQITIASRNRMQAQALADFFNQKSGEQKVLSKSLDVVSLQPLLEHTGLIVNTTPVGMYPKTDVSPWPDGLSLPKNAFIYDLIYNPSQTLFLDQAHDVGLPSANGLGMLIEQAALSFEIWTGKVAPRDVMSTVISQIP
jgi:shikimate dehydrogenase